ncbi:MAG: MFS transporter [Spirochaetaceae bacterium]
MGKKKGYYTIPKMILLNLVGGGGVWISIIVNSSLMKYFTDVVGLSPAMYGLVFLIFSIWNGVNDPVIGYWADKQPFRKGIGKYKPLIRYSIPVIGIPMILILLSPPSWSQMLIAVSLLVLLVIYEGAQTLLNVSFMAFTVNTFISMDDRTEVQVIGSYVKMIPTFLGGMIPIWFLTGDYSQGTLVAIFSVSILLGLALVWFGSKFVKEDPKFYEKLEVTRGLKQLFRLGKELFTDRTFLLFITAFLFIQAATGNYFAGYIYYMDNVVLVSGLKATIPDLITGFAQMAILPLVVLAVRKNGALRTLWKGLIISVIGFAILGFQINYWVAAAAYIVILLGFAFPSAINEPLAGLVIDHIELKTGKRQPGVVRGIMAVVMIPAASFQPLILSTLLSATGYDGTVKVQAPEVVQAIRIGTGFVPAAILTVGIILLACVPLGLKREREIQKGINEKHAAHI